MFYGVRESCTVEVVRVIINVCLQHLCIWILLPIYVNMIHVVIILIDRNIFKTDNYLLFTSRVLLLVCCVDYFVKFIYFYTCTFCHLFLKQVLDLYVLY